MTDLRKIGMQQAAMSVAVEVLLEERDALRAELARVRTQVAEEIANELMAIAEDEAQRPSRDAVSHAIETWMKTASVIARNHVRAPSSGTPKEPTDG